MPGRAKSDTVKALALRKEKDDLVDRAAAAYLAEQSKPDVKGRKGSRTIAKDFMQLHLEATGRHIKISHETIIKRAAGRSTRAKAAQTHEWLLPNEVEIVIRHILKSAEQGFPLSHRRLKEDVDRIVQARMGSEFPEEGVGKHWTRHFVEKHSHQLKTAWSTPLKTKRAKGANPTANKAWWKLLKEVLDKYDIKTFNTYAIDEVGCQPYGAEREQVIGGKQASPHYQQRSGSRETITVLVCICADGTSLPPAVIFKGKGYQVKWAQDNPANASYVFIYHALTAFDGS